jgi:hypothetical protein
MQKNESTTNPKEIVISFQESLNKRDLGSARRCVSDNFVLSNPTGSFDNADKYFEAVKQAGQAHPEPCRFEVKKLFIDGSDVCVFNDVIAGSITIFACGWYHIEDQKIQSLKLVYDPRPLLQKEN